MFPSDRPPGDAKARSAVRSALVS
uniref:Uncharacterized protein n=1 Tax=Anguilla anguilla TaxID=7936 RepID=A0A0E9TN69_ANGAN